MLIQSHEGYIHLLPALPAEWKDGSFEGLTARGGFVVSAKWQNAVLQEICVRAKVGGKLKIVAEGIEIEKDTAANEDFVWRAT